MGLFFFEEKANSKSVCTKKAELWDWKVKHFPVTYVTSIHLVCACTLR